MDGSAVSTFDEIARASPEYVADLYRRYRADPRSVDERWALVFAGYEFGADARPAGGADAPPANAVAKLAHSYRELGHIVADVDPLDRAPRSHPLLELSELGFGKSDLQTPVAAGGAGGLGRAPLRDLLDALRETYCGPIGVEYLAIADKAQREWLQEHMEPSRNRPSLTDEDRRRILERLISAEVFEQFLAAKFVGQKRFSLEGGEALIPLLDELVETAAADGAGEMVMGMPHRGRLNVLAHILGKPHELVLAEFEGSSLPWDGHGDGDVKYHLGYSKDHVTRAGRAIHLSMTSNPSHLEVVNPVVEGIVRAKQANLADTLRRRVVPVLMHGDAAFLGQGSVYETLMLSGLPAFTTGGTVHVIINNQIGFTTDPADYRITRYPTAAARVVQAPVFHVNGDEPEAVVQAARLAIQFRQTFRLDVFVDFACYRRHGHNEQDDPTLTQPALYRTIHSHPTVAEQYGQRLEASGVVDAATRREMRERARAALDQALVVARERMPRQKAMVFGGLWTGLGWAGDDWRADTAVKAERLKAIVDVLRQPPSGFTPTARAKRLLEERWQMVERGEGIDWGCAEMLAYGSLLLEGVPVRISGQDTVRGTFGHRHAAVFDARSGAAWVPLAGLAAGPGDVRGRQQPALRAGGDGVRVRHVERRSAAARRVGGAVRRLRQRRADHHRPVRGQRRVEVAANERPRADAAARLRGPGAGALERAPRALPPALRGGQHAGGELHHPGAAVPRAAPPDAPAVSQAAGDDEPEELAAPSPLRLRPCGLHRGALSDHYRRCARDRFRSGRARHRVLGEDLLRARRRPRRARVGLEPRHRPDRGAVSVPRG